MKPSNSTVAIVGIGVPLATIISWVLNTFAGVEVPGPVEAAFGAVLAALVGYFFVGGRAVDTEDDVNDRNDQAGFARPLMLALLLAVSVPAAVMLPACTTLGLAPAKSFDERWSYAQAQTTGLRDASTRALDAKLISSADMEYCISVADRSSDMLKLARGALDVGDLSTAEARLRLVTNILTELESYLTARTNP